MSSRQRRPGLRVVISDLIDPGGQVARPFEWEPALRRMAARHDVIVVEVIDPRELALPEVGVLTLTDPEWGCQREVATTAPLREAYRRAAERHRTETAAAVRGCGSAHLVVRTDQDWVADLARFVRARRRPPTDTAVRLADDEPPEPIPSADGRRKRSPQPSGARPPLTVP